MAIRMWRFRMLVATSVWRHLIYRFDDLLGRRRRDHGQSQLQRANLVKHNTEELLWFRWLLLYGHCLSAFASVLFISATWIQPGINVSLVALVFATFYSLRLSWPWSRSLCTSSSA